MLRHPARSASALLLVAGLALVPAADAKPKKKGPGPQYLQGEAVYESVIVTRCPIISSNDAWSIETATTVYRHQFAGEGPIGKSKGSMKVKGEHVYTLDRKVEGFSESIKPYTIGPTTRPIATREGGWKDVVSKVKSGKVRGRQQYAMFLDFRGLDSTLKVDATVPVPKPGDAQDLSVTTEPATKDLTDQGGKCTASETVTIKADMQFGRYEQRR